MVVQYNEKFCFMSNIPRFCKVKGNRIWVNSYLNTLTIRNIHWTNETPLFPFGSYSRWRYVYSLFRYTRFNRRVPNGNRDRSELKRIKITDIVNQWSQWINFFSARNLLLHEIFIFTNRNGGIINNLMKRITEEMS